MNENLEIGDTGDNVVILQQKLKMIGLYNAVVTGSFGLATEEGVKAFQRKVGIDDTGIVNNETWEILRMYTEPAAVPISTYPTIGIGSSGSYVRDLQTKLKALLYYTGEVSGEFDLETETAVKRFQLNNELTADGKVGNQTWSLINLLYGNLNSCVLEDDSSEADTYTVVKGDIIFMGNYKPKHIKV